MSKTRLRHECRLASGWSTASPFSPGSYPCCLGSPRISETGQRRPRPPPADRRVEDAHFGTRCRRRALRHEAPALATPRPVRGRFFAFVGYALSLNRMRWRCAEARYWLLQAPATNITVVISAHLHWRKSCFDFKALRFVLIPRHHDDAPDQAAHQTSCLPFVIFAIERFQSQPFDQLAITCGSISWRNGWCLVGPHGQFTRQRSLLGRQLVQSGTSNRRIGLPLLNELKQPVEFLLNV